MSLGNAMPVVMGWDVGGAHLKAVLVDADGRVLAARQVYCPLWRGLHELEQAVDIILHEVSANKHVVTMTGELADIFPNRHAGVIQIAHTLQQKLIAFNAGASVKFFTGKLGPVTLDAVHQHTSAIASMNWLASVQYVAKKSEQAIFVDVGSTTTDIAIVRHGEPLMRGFCDAERMQFDELVYTGVVRTPLMALAHKIPFAGQWVNVAAEHFATTADVYILTGDLSPTENMAETADGAEKNIEASARRIARMVGRDSEDAPISSWRNLAYAFKHAQLDLIKNALLTQLSVLNDMAEMTIVGAGTGEFLVKELALMMGYRYESASGLIKAESDVVRNMAKICFPAFAVAALEMVD